MFIQWGVMTLGIGMGMGIVVAWVTIVGGWVLPLFLVMIAVLSTQVVELSLSSLVDASSTQVELSSLVDMSLTQVVVIVVVRS